MFALLLLSSFSLNSQNTNLSTPFIHNYKEEIYQAGTQNWDIAQHPNGFMFFANNSGLLQFDGTNWQVFPLDNKTFTRSIYIAASGKIYVGGQGEFGYFKPNETGLLQYHSLLPKIPLADRLFSDVWEIIEHKGKIYFNASDKVYEVGEKEVNVYKHGKIKFLGQGNQRLFIGNEEGLLEIQEGTVKKVTQGEQLANVVITEVVDYGGDNLIFSTKKRGLFLLNRQRLQPMQHAGSELLKNQEIYCAAVINPNLIALSIVSKGLVLMDTMGTFLHLLSKQNGLQNNNVLSAYSDKKGNLWLGLDNGIDYVDINTSFSKIIVDKEQEGAVYSVAVHEDKLYFATSTGLYQQSWKDYYNPLEANNFTRIKGTEGSAWGLDEIEDDLFLGHHEGGFVINDSQIKKATPSSGNWVFRQLKNHPDYLLVGTYNGLELLKRKGQAWEFVRAYEVFQASCRMMEQDQAGNIWVAHPYRGIYKVQVAADLKTIQVKLYGPEDGLPSQNLNNVFEVNEELIFTGETGVFNYNPTTDSFEHNVPFEELIGKEQSIQRLIEDKKGNIWFTTTTETGILKFQDKGITKSFSKVVFPELHTKLVERFESIYPYDEYNVFIGAKKDVIHFNPSKQTSATDKPLTANIVKVETSNDSILLHGQYQKEGETTAPTFSNALNTFKFNYTAPHFQNHQNITYTTKLEGFDEDWSEWRKNTEKEYTNLSSGSYTFLVKARTIDNIESSIASYTFSIDPPWYATNRAILGYVVLGLLSLANLIFIPRRRFQKEKAFLESENAKQEEEHQRIRAKKEQEIIALKNKQLEIEVAHKNKELAANAMHLVQRKELILKLQDPLNRILKKTTDATAIAEIKRVNKLLSKDSELEEDWDQFATYFDQVHLDFLKRIRQKYPQLTANDQKFCAFLRMNLSTKEMAPLLNISVRGVEAGRYRLRKKMGLDSTVNLNDFINSL